MIWTFVITAVHEIQYRRYMCDLSIKVIGPGHPSETYISSLLDFALAPEDRIEGKEEWLRMAQIHRLYCQDNHLL